MHCSLLQLRRLTLAAAEPVADVRVAPQTAVMAGLGPLFGLTRMQAVRSGLLLAAGGEFAFVALCALTSASGACLSVMHMRWHALACRCSCSVLLSCTSGRLVT